MKVFLEYYGLCREFLILDGNLSQVSSFNRKHTIELPTGLYKVVLERGLWATYLVVDGNEVKQQYCTDYFGIAEDPGKDWASLLRVKRATW